MAKDAVATMGEILTDDVGGRDAVHVAVIAVTAGEPLWPGQAVKVDTKTEPLTAHLPDIDDETLGIVDPFLTTRPTKGQRFWLYLYPRTITSLRHNWTHPRFADAKPGETYARPTERAESEAWLRNWCQSNDAPSYEDTVALAVRGPEDGDDYLLVHGYDAHASIPEEFWGHIENVTGRTIQKERRASYFSCSC